MYPTNPKPNLFTGKTIDATHKENYKTLINDLYGVNARTLNATDSQVEIYKKWQHEKVEECHNDDLETLIQSKLETYVWRFALIIEMMDQAAKGDFKDNLSDESLNKAIKLVEYFRVNALRVYDKMSSNNPLDSLSENQRNLYNELPLEFTKGEKEDLFEKHHVSGGTLGRFLSKTELFKRVKQGSYKKKFE